MEIVTAIRLNPKDDHDDHERLQKIKNAGSRAWSYMMGLENSYKTLITPGVLITAETLYRAMIEFGQARHMYGERLKVNSAFLPREEGEAILAAIEEAREIIAELQRELPGGLR